MNEYQELQEAARKESDRLLGEKRKRYQYARSQGFTAQESKILSHKSAKAIDRIVALREVTNE